jgi:serine/threonine protein kinase
VDANCFSIEEEDDEICEWKQGEFIGSGSFGQVFQAMDCKSGKIFAIKKIRVIADDRQQLKKEISFMRRLKHPHIIKFLGFDEDQEFVHIYLEFMP